MNVILLGPPGAGKGTQARLIEKQHHLALIATGEILRAEVNKGTPLGLQVKETMEGGRFPPDEIILQIFGEALGKYKDQGVVLDGVPRTLNQAQKIDQIFEHYGLCLDAVIQIAVDDEELIKRLSGRMICKACQASYTLDVPPKREGKCDKCSGQEFMRRPDDEPEAIRVRLQVYNEQTKPLLDYYAKTDRLRVVDGMKSVEEVNVQIEALLGQLQVLTDKSGCLYSAQDI